MLVLCFALLLLIENLYGKVLLMPEFPKGVILKCTKEGKVLKSDDFGLSWKNLPVAGSKEVFITSLASDIKATVLIATTKGAGVFQSADNGESWRQSDLPTSYTWTGVTADHLGKYLAVVSSEGSIFVSSNGGETWKESTSVAMLQNQWTSVVSDRAGQYLTATSADNGMFVSFDFGDNWIKASTSEGLRKWRDVSTDFTGQFLAAISEDDNDQIYRSEDFGLTWIAMPIENKGESEHRAWQAVASDRHGAFLAALTKDGVLYTSTNYGSTWNLITTLPIHKDHLRHISFDGEGARLLALSDDASGSYYSQDGGATWQTHFSSLHPEGEGGGASEAAFESLFSGYKQGFVPRKVRQQIQSLNQQAAAKAGSGNNANFGALLNQYEDFLFSTDVAPEQEFTGAPTSEPSSMPSDQPSSEPSSQPSSQPSSMPTTPFLDVSSSSVAYEVRNAYSFAAIDSDSQAWLWGGSQLASSDVQHRLVSNVKSVVGSLYAYVIVFTTGEFEAWGAKTATDGWDSYTDFKLSQVVATENAFAAITTTGGVIAFGSVGHGGLISSQFVPYLQSSVVGLVANAGAFCAWKADGSVFSWGNRFTGGNDVSSLTKTNLRKVEHVYATRGAFAALTNAGNVLTWGDCNRGGCQTGISDVIALTASPSVFVALSGKYEIMAWGNQQYGGSLPVSVKAAIGKNTASIYHTVGAIAVLLTTGTVVTWGDSSFGGDSSSVSSQLIDVKSVTSTDRAFAALTKTGKVIVWGDSSFGGSIPTALSASLSSGVKSVKGTKAAFAAVASDGKVVSWGDSLYGGDSSSVSSKLSTVSAVQANVGGFIAVDTEGAVAGWGNAAVFETSGIIDQVSSLPLKFLS